MPNQAPNPKGPSFSKFADALVELVRIARDQGQVIPLVLIAASFLLVAFLAAALVAIHFWAADQLIEIALCAVAATAMFVGTIIAVRTLDEMSAVRKLKAEVRRVLNPIYIRHLKNDHGHAVVENMSVESYRESWFKTGRLLEE